jgi:hypothetical protein
MPTANRSAKSPVARRCKHADGSGEDKRIRLANVGHLAAFDDISRDRRALPSNGIVVIPSPFHRLYLGFRRGAALSLAVKMGLTSMSSLRSPQPWASLLWRAPFGRPRANLCPHANVPSTIYWLVANRLRCGRQGTASRSVAVCRRELDVGEPDANAGISATPNLN